MARSRILAPDTNDIISDSGGVLFSLVRGEQLEFPVTLNFVDDATANTGYDFEAVVVEAANNTSHTGKIVGEDYNRPTSIEPSGVQNTLVVRVPTYRGTWQDVQAYNREEIVLHNTVYYRLTEGAGRVNSTTPDQDPLWVVTLLNKIYVQFPDTLASNYAVQPTVKSPIYGFFELRVTEPTDSIYSRTWKPIRGMVEFLFSPTDIVPDV